MAASLCPVYDMLHKTDMRQLVDVQDCIGRPIVKHQYFLAEIKFPTRSSITREVFREEEFQTHIEYQQLFEQTKKLP